MKKLLSVLKQVPMKLWGVLALLGVAIAVIIKIVLFQSTPSAGREVLQRHLEERRRLRNETDKYLSDPSNHPDNV